MPTLEQARARFVIPGSSRLRSLLSSHIGTHEIGWTHARVPGWCTVFVAASPAGATRLDLLTHDAGVSDALARVELPTGVTTRREAGLRPLVDEVMMWLARPDRALDLPLDIEGTAFQSDVWRELLDVQPGETSTYSDLAKRIGRPRATRAVGQAIGANPVALAIPCHRVVASHGSLGGYAWGPELKERLLAAERSACGG